VLGLGPGPVAEPAASPLPIFSDQIDASRSMRALAGPDRRRACSDLGAAQLRTFREKAPRLLLHGHTAKAGLQPQALGDLVVEVADDDRRHNASIAG
jgi:hypothetical protein